MLMAFILAAAMATTNRTVHVNCACGAITTVKFERARTDNPNVHVIVRYGYGGSSAHQLNPGEAIEVLYERGFDTFDETVMYGYSRIGAVLPRAIRAVDHPQDAFGTVHVPLTTGKEK